MKHLVLGVYRGDSDSCVRFLEARGHITGPHELRKRIYIHLSSPVTTQEFFQPRFVFPDSRIYECTI